MRARAKASVQEKTLQRLLVSDIDNTLTGDDAALAELMAVLKDNQALGFAVASGRSYELIRDAIVEFGLLEPDLTISSVGSEINGNDDIGERYRDHISPGWDREKVVETLGGVAGLTLQGEQGQKPFKVSFDTAGEVMPEVRGIVNEAGLNVTLIPSHNEFLDVLPERASKGKAVRFVAEAYGMSLDNIVVAGDSGNDDEMLTCGARAVMVGNYSEELAHLVDNPAVYVSKAKYAAGVLEGLQHYGVIESKK